RRRRPAAPPPPPPIPTSPIGRNEMATNVPPGAPNTAGITSRDDGSDLDHIRTAILALQIFAEGNHDDQELAAVHKCIVALQGVLADHAKNRDPAVGVTPAVKHVRRVSRGSGY